MKHKSAAMADPTELHSFFHKFLNLWHAGKTACLSLECQAGEARLDLQLRLAHHHPPPLHPHQKSRPGPSRLRRRARRAKARETAAAKVASAAVTATVDVAVQAASPVPPYKIDAAVQAAAPRTAEAAVQAGPVPQQLSAQIHPTLTAVQAGPTLHHPPRSHQAVQAGPVLQQHPTQAHPTGTAVQAGPVYQQHPTQAHPTRTAVQAVPTLHHPPRPHQAARSGGLHAAPRPVPPPTSLWYPPIVVDDMMCRDVDYEKEMLLDNQRELRETEKCQEHSTDD